MEEKKGSKPQLDLKARLSLGAKSRRAQALEEEQKKAAEQKAREEEQRKASAEKVEEKKADQFTLAGAGPARENWSAAWDVSEEELKSLEALPSKGRGARGIITSIIVVIALVFAAATGYYFGRAFFGRSLENHKIREAQDVLSYVSDTRADYFKAIEDHKKKVKEVVEALEKKDVSIEFQLGVIQEFLKHCDQFLQKYKPIAAKALLPTRGGRTFLVEIVPDIAEFADRVNTMFVLTSKMVQERQLLALIGAGDGSDEQKKGRANAFLSAADKKKLFEQFPPSQIVVTSKPRKTADGTDIPWSKGDFLIKIGDVTVAEAADGAAPNAPKRYQAEVTAYGAEAPLKVDTEQIADVDPAPLVMEVASLAILRRENMYRFALLERVKAGLRDLAAVSATVRWDMINKKLHEYGDKDEYFTF